MAARAHRHPRHPASECRCGHLAGELRPVGARRALAAAAGGAHRALAQRPARGVLVRRDDLDAGEHPSDGPRRAHRLQQRLERVARDCVALSAAITVLIASALGLPVSSTHIAVGAVFGVGFFREWQTARKTHINHGRIRKGLKPSEMMDPEERVKRRRLVRRQHVVTIASAWVVTVPATALLAAGLFWGLRTLF